MLRNRLFSVFNEKARQSKKYDSVSYNCKLFVKYDGQKSLETQWLFCYYFRGKYTAFCDK